MTHRHVFPLTWLAALVPGLFSGLLWAQAQPGSQPDAAAELAKVRDACNKVFADANQTQLTTFAPKEWAAAKASLAIAEAKAKTGDAAAATALYQQAAREAREAIQAAVYAETFKKSQAAANDEEAKKQIARAVPVLLALGKETEPYVARGLLAQLEELIPKDPRLPSLRDKVKAMPTPKETHAYVGDLGRKPLPIKLVLIPAGTFTMGSPADETERCADEGPRREVTISKPFYISIYEITNLQWANASQYGGLPVGDAAQRPAAGMNWDQAADFCRRMCDPKTKRTVRLPTEAEWEYACRAGAAARYNTGDDESASLDAGWYLANSDGQTHPVAQKKPNAWGLYDMHGNAWEWCSDWYNPYPPDKAVDPKGAGWSPSRVARGGSWRCRSRIARSAYRYVVPSNFACDDIGFRIVVTWDPL